MSKRDYYYDKSGILYAIFDDVYVEYYYTLGIWLKSSISAEKVKKQLTYFITIDGNEDTTHTTALNAYTLLEDAQRYE